MRHLLLLTLLAACGGDVDCVDPETGETLDVAECVCPRDFDDRCNPPKPPSGILPYKPGRP